MRSAALFKRISSFCIYRCSSNAVSLRCAIQQNRTQRISTRIPVHMLTRQHMSLQALLLTTRRRASRKLNESREDRDCRWGGHNRACGLRFGALMSDQNNSTMGAFASSKAWHRSARAVVGYPIQATERVSNAGAQGVMHTLLHAMGNPQVGLPVVQIVGTKGKGSVTAMLSAMLQNAGYTVGSYTR